MKCWQLKLVAAACAVVGLNDAHASSPLNWQAGVNIGQRGWDSPGYLDQKIDFRVASISVSAGFAKYFASALYETSIGDEPIELAIDNSKMAGYPSFDFRNSGAGNAKRSEFSMVGGYNFTNSFSAFVGYVTTEVNISNLSQLFITDISPGANGSANALLVFLNGGVKYATHGPFVGAGYRVPVNEWGAFSFSLAYAHLNASGTINSGAEYVAQYYSLQSGDQQWALKESSPASIDDTSGTASGFSYGVSWFGKFAGDNELLQSMRYVVAAKLYKYDYNGAAIVRSQTNSDSNETYTVLTMGLTKTF